MRTIMTMTTMMATMMTAMEMMTIAPKMMVALMRAATTRNKLILRQIFCPFLSLASKSFDPIVTGFTCPPSSALDFSSLCCATGYYGLRVLVVVMIYLRRCSIGLCVFYIYRSRNILGGVAQSDRGFDLRGMLRPYFWIKSGN